MPASERMRRPAAIAAPPIQLASTGLAGYLCAYGLSRSAVAVGSVMSCGVRMTRSPSLSFSSPATAIAFA